MKKGDIVLITGGNSGMGKATSIELAKQGAHVVILCRSKERGEAALQEIRAESNNQLVDLMLCDLGSKSSIREFVKNFKEKYNRLDILINNAGVILPGRHLTTDGYELQFGVNHLGHFLLTNLLLETMKNNTDARIINVSSGAHKAGKMYFHDINLEKNYSIIRAYSRSKLANVLFTNELSRRLKCSGITVNCLHPGAVATSMGINRKTGFGTFITSLLKPFFLTAVKGADTAIFLATAPEVKGMTGKYFYKRKAISSSKTSYDEALAKKLWDISVEMTQ